MVRSGGDRGNLEGDRTHVASDDRVGHAATGRRVEVQLHGREVLHDIRRLLLKECGGETRGLQPVNSVDELLLPDR